MFDARYPSGRGLALAAMLLLAACGGRVPPPNDAITGAELAVQQAETAQAAVHSPAELLRARQKLEGAREAVREERYSLARRLAEEAQADAQLAIARSRATVAEQTTRQLEQGVEALREETAPRQPAIQQTPLVQ